jgi:hypothetical protein
MFIFLLASLLLDFSLVAENLILPKNQILVTDKGILYEVDGQLAEAISISYVGNGLYMIGDYGHCGRCGWILDEDGKCTNQICDQFGPRKD